MMKTLFTFLVTIATVISACSQQNPPRLIVRGDDMGFSHSGNEALIKSYKEGIQTSIEIIVPSPWFPEAVKMLEQNPNTDVGIHLAITSEWDNVKWRPVAHVPSLTDEDGYFYPFIWQNKSYPGRAILENKWTIEDIEKEFRAQIELALKKIPRISHISGHMGCTHISKEVTALVEKLIKEYKIPIELQPAGLKYIGYDGPHGTFDEKKQSFIKMLDNLKPGESYVFVDHPGLDTPELKAIHHIGYENVASDRQGVTDLFIDANVKEAIKKKGIKLISYAELK
jgi:chitin disaccharide deacetylase